MLGEILNPCLPVRQAGLLTAVVAIEHHARTGHDYDQQKDSCQVCRALAEVAAYIQKELAQLKGLNDLLAPLMGVPPEKPEKT